MEIIPAINCPDFECVKKRLIEAAEFLLDGSWIQLDIADGKFTPHKTWNEPSELKELQTADHRLSQMNLEVHLMMERPTEAMLGWILLAKRIILHLEAVSPTDFLMNPVDRKFEIGLSISPETPVDKLLPRLSNIKFVQFLAVSPGRSGQKFNEGVTEKIKFLKKNYPAVKIEVDGGINLETAKLCKAAGADILVVATYIFESKDPKKAYEELRSV